MKYSENFAYDLVRDAISYANIAVVNGNNMQGNVDRINHLVSKVNIPNSDISSSLKAISNQIDRVRNLPLTIKNMAELALKNSDKLSTQLSMYKDFFDLNNLGLTREEINQINFDGLWDKNILINVVKPDGSDIGTYALDEYVAGVISGESVIREYYMDNFRRGKCSYEEMLGATMAFALQARSYAICQTVESPLHSEDHKIEASSVKQNFSSTRLDGVYRNFKDPRCGEEMAQIAKLAAYLTSGQVLISDGQVANAHYRFSTQKNLIKEARDNDINDYIGLLSLVYPTGYKNEYPEGLSIGFYDYSNRTVIE